MRHRRISLFLVALTMLLCGAAQAQGTAPAATVARLHAVLADLANSDGCTARIDAVSAVVDESFDMPAIARRMLRGHWSALDDAQRQAFVDALTGNTVLQYVTRFGGASNIHFSSGSEQAQGATLMRVDTLLHREKDAPVSLQYLLHAGSGLWRIVNVTADGVSDAALRRSQYDSQIKKEGFDALVAGLREQNAQLRKACETG